MAQNGQKREKNRKKFQNFKIFRYCFLHVQISFFHYFSDFCPKIEPKFDHFFLNFEFHPSLLIRFSDPEIPIVHLWLTVLADIWMKWTKYISFHLVPKLYFHIIILSGIPSIIFIFSTQRTDRLTCCDNLNF